LINTLDDDGLVTDSPHGNDLRPEPLTFQIFFEAVEVSPSDAIFRLVQHDVQKSANLGNAITVKIEIASSRLLRFVFNVL